MGHLFDIKIFSSSSFSFLLLSSLLLLPPYSSFIAQINNNDNIHRVINTSRLLSNVLVSDIVLNLETEKICDVMCAYLLYYYIMSRGREGYSVSSLRAFSYSISRGRIANLSSFSTRTHTTQKNNY